MGHNDGMRWIFGLLKLLVLVVVLAGVGLWAATTFFGLRVEFAGTGMTPVFSFHDPDAHIAALEAERAAQAQDPPPVAAEPEPPVAEVSAKEAEESEGAPPEEAAAPAPLHAPWPEYRGNAQRDGVYRQTSIRTDWPAEGLEELWRTKVGGGYASMVVAQGLVFTIEQRRDREVVAAYDFTSGRQVWEHSWEALFQETMGGDGPRATPTWADGKLYALGATGELRALEATTGKQIWRTNILEDAGAGNLQWGMSGAPLVADGMVIVLPGGDDGKAVAAYDATDGSIVWQSESGKAGYVAAQLETIAGERQVVVFAATRVFAVRPENGELLWSHPWPSSYEINAAQPIRVDEDHLLISTEYGVGSALLQIQRDGDSFSARELWKKNTLKNKFNSSVVHEGQIYGFDGSILASIDPMTGERNWKGGRYGFGQLLLAGGHLIVLTEKGEVVLVKPTASAHEELARFQALEGKTWNVPAIADGVLLVRNQTEMAAYRLQ